MEQVSVMLEPLRAMLTQVGVFLPKLVLAIVVLVLGWLLAKLLRFGANKLLAAINFKVLAERAGMDDFLKAGGLKTDTAGVIALLVYWFVLLAALMVAFNGLGLAYVTELVGRILLFVPKVLVAVLLLAVGAYFARFVSKAISTYGRNVGMPEADLLARVAWYAITIFVVVVALDQVNIGGEIIRQSFLIVLGGAVLALAIAFGLGGQRWAGQVLERMLPGGSRGKSGG